MRRISTTLIALSCLTGVALADDVAGTCNEGTTCVIWATLCDDAKATTDATNCPDGGAKIDTSALTAVTFRVSSRFCTGLYQLLGNTSASTSANPVKLTIPSANVLAVGKCSNDRSTCCTTDSECGSGNTCEIDKQPKDQLTILTVKWTWTNGQGTARIPFRIRTLEDYPFP